VTFSRSNIGSRNNSFLDRNSSITTKCSVCEKNGNTPNRLKEGDTPIGQADYPDGFKAKNEKAVEKE